MLRFLFLLLLLSSLSINPAFSQKIMNSKEPRREIRFIDLTQPEQASYWHRYHEITRLVINAITQGEIGVCLLDYTKQAKVEKISIDDFVKRITIPANKDVPAIQDTNKNALPSYDDFPVLIEKPVENYSYEFFPTDISLIGLDQTTGKGESDGQVHFVNFYIPDSLAKETGVDPYLFSVLWKDFIKILESYTETLYAKNSYGSWWRGDVILTHNEYAIDRNMSGEFLRLGESAAKLRAVDYFGKKGSIDLFSFNKKPPYQLDIFIRDKKINSHFYLSEIILETIPDWFVYGKGERISFAWKDLMKVAADSAWLNRSEAYLLAEAFRMQKWKYSRKPSQLISKNGRFEKGGIDSLCKNSFPSSFGVTKPKEINQFELDVYEGLFLEDSLNAHLHRPGHSIVELIHENLFNGNLSGYANDSLNTRLTIEEIYAQACLVLDTKYQTLPASIKKGDTLYINKNVNGTNYFTANKNIGAADFVPTDSLLKMCTPLILPLYKPQQLHVLETVYTSFFNKEGKNKQYKLKALNINIPHDINVKGIQFIICSVLWDELRPLLLKDPRAMIEYKGRTLNLVEIMEERFFFQYYYKSAFLREKQK